MATKKLKPEPLLEHIKLNVRDLTGNLYSIEADPAWSLLEVKEAVEKATHIPPVEQRLIVDTVELNCTKPFLLHMPSGIATIDVTLIRARRTEEQLKYMALVQEDYNVLRQAREDIRDDFEVMFTAVQARGLALEYASDQLKEDRGLVQAAVSTTGMALRYASPLLQADRSIVLTAVKNDGYAYKFAAPFLYADREIILEAVRGCRDPLKVATPELKADREIVLAAVENNGYALEYAADSLREDIAIVEVAVQQAGERVRKFAKC